MKTFIRTIVVLVLLNLATGCFASAQSGYGREEMEAAKEDMKKAGQEMKESGQKMELAMQHDMEYEKAARRAEEAERRGENIVVPQVRGKSTGPLPLPSFAGSHGGSGRIFVVPTSEMKAEDVATIVEDMRVMSRIFDKKLGLSPGGMYSKSVSWGSGYGFGFFGSSARSTEAIFLQGYGVLFLLKVDFPLSPPAEEQEETEEEPKEHIDELWKETRQEIYEPADAERRRAGKEEEEEYDEKKVEEMKETLIKALMHTTNIRNLKSDESVILTVAGSGDSSGAGIALGYGAGQVLIKDNGTVKIGPSTKGMDFTPTVMTIRVKKSDVDAFSKDKLDFDKFRQKVQIFTY